MRFLDKLERAIHSFIIGVLIGSAVGAFAMALTYNAALHRCVP